MYIREVWIRHWQSKMYNFKVTKLFKTHFLLILFMCVYIVFALVTYKTYGITADESYRYNRGSELLQHFLTSKPLQTTIMPTIEPDLFSFYTLTLNVLNPRNYYEIFHLLNMLFATSVLVAIYCIVYTYSKNPLFSILGPIFTILTPNFSGHFPANPIDIPFACALVGGFFLTYYFRKTQFSFYKIISLGIIFWLVQCLRPLGFQIYLIYVLMAFVYKEKTQSWKSFITVELKTLVLIFIIANFLMVITWPYIAINYFKNLPALLIENASYSKWDNLIFFMGRYLQHTERPWYYLFIYILFTLPVYILGLAGFSLVNRRNNLKLMVLLILGLNFGLYLILQPVIYNGMRHFLFIVPFFIVLACFGLWDLLHLSISVNFKKVIIAILLVSISLVFFCNSAYVSLSVRLF